ncbi:bifunctional UDP-N-acetylglucosamine diphosphorylase/glucosamine-1-phosphate N-acetyltransferase GlmU [Oleidesulfovibrio sp.]|uniref:bifunctional UDP-N-acetylglucosamine diphosphorylase/glucosamine-1-phosphate N-acetyltransferase GlmU n=1 Tax=Oleidesulfovibrio sp. TaxID=2909707 RepID=UPI003A852E7D
MSSHKYSIGAVILAAGKGTRMFSHKPKVLQELLGEPILRFVYRALDPIIQGGIWTVIGHGAQLVRDAFAEEQRSFVMQEEQLGTGHALQCAWDDIAASGAEFILAINGDTPLVQQSALEKLVAETTAAQADVGFITLTLDEKNAFGRVVRVKGKVNAIVEVKDYDENTFGPEPNEVNAGIYLLKVATVAPLLSRLSNANANGEYYITDIIGLAVTEELHVHGVECGHDTNLMGVNTPAELARSEESLRRQIVESHLERGVHIHAPESVRIGPEVTIEPGAIIHGPCELYGKTAIGAEAVIHSHCWVKNSVLHPACELRNFSHVEQAEIGTGAVAGPYARLRPGAVMEEDARVGNFVEMKKAILRKGAKASHLTYLGDADVGSEANIGAGTITCNYDGINKHRTIIGAKAFIGSNSALVAPVKIGDEALVGAGSVITKDVEDGELAIARGRQKNLRKKRHP